MNLTFKLFLTALISIVLSACSFDFDDDDSSSSSPKVITSTLQGTVFDAVTGERITDKSLKVTLVQGKSYRNASVKTGSSDFAGDYALSSIPTSVNSNLTYRIDIRVDGYQRLQAAINFNAAATEEINPNLLGNVYLFPLGLTAPDQTVTVLFNNEPVEGATVLLQPTTSTNVLTSDSSNILQAASDGFLGANSAVTDVNGNAVFAGANLALGGSYNIDVLPAVHEGTQLAQTTGTTVVIGTSTVMQTVNLTDLAPGNDNGLYILSASNSDNNTVDSNGQLVLVFSREITLVHESITQASLVGATTATLDNTTVPDTTVTVSLAADNITLTLTPNFTVAPEFFSGSNPTTADNGMLVQFSNLFVRVKDSDEDGELFDVFADLSNTSGTAPSNSVQATTDF